MNMLKASQLKEPGIRSAEDRSTLPKEKNPKIGPSMSENLEKNKLHPACLLSAHHVKRSVVIELHSDCSRFKCKKIELHLKYS